MKNAVIQLARRALPLMGSAHRHEAEKIIAAFERSGAPDPFGDYLNRAGTAFEMDMQPIVGALVAALHAEDEDGLRSLRRLLPGLLRQANRAPSLAAVIAEAMAHAFYSAFYDEPGSNAQHTANAGAERVGSVLFSEDPVVTEAMKQWRSRSVFETDFSSAELRGFSQALRNRSVFSARTTNADYLQEVAATVDDILNSKIGMAEGRVRLLRKLKQLGYDPAVGFPQDMAAIPPAERDSLQDLSSQRRLDLLLETNVRMAQGYAQVVAGSGEYARYAYPAWELVRLYVRETPRGSAESKSVGWERRWTSAGEAVNWQGAIGGPHLRDGGVRDKRQPEPGRDSPLPRERKEGEAAPGEGRMIALKDSPIWQALGDGDGGYTDTLLNPFPPFAFRSGMAWKAVPREQCVKLGLVTGEEKPAVVTATLTPGEKEVRKIVDEMPADLRAELERELAS